MTKEKFSKEEAAKVLAGLGLTGRYDANEFYMGINVELEHGTVDPATNVTDDDPEMTAKIALAHLNEIPYYLSLIHISEPTRLGMISYAVFCLKKKKKTN